MHENIYVYMYLYTYNCLKKQLPEIINKHEKAKGMYEGNLPG